MFRILVVEDDSSTNRLFCAILRRAGYEPVPAGNGEEALQKMDEQQFDLLLCDLMMPKMDGYTLTKTIRESGSMLPILMVTAKALLRRAKIVDERKITLGTVVLEYGSHTVRREHELITLPPKEFELLYKLLTYPEQTFTRMQLLDEIWGLDSESDARTVNVHINRLRTRFMDWPEFEIQTVRGLGYRAIRKAADHAE